MLFYHFDLFPVGRAAAASGRASWLVRGIGIAGVKRAPIFMARLRWALTLPPSCLLRRLPRRAMMAIIDYFG